MVCGYPSAFNHERSGAEVDSLIELLKHPANVDSEKMRKTHLYEIEEELWMG